MTVLTVASLLLVSYPGERAWSCRDLAHCVGGGFRGAWGWAKGKILFYLCLGVGLIYCIWELFFDRKGEAVLLLN